MRPLGEIRVSMSDGFIKRMVPVARAIDDINAWIGRNAALLIVAAILISALNATIRKTFDVSSNAWLELQWILFAIVFLLCAPWTLLSNEHIRIDVVNNMMPKWLRDTIDVIGHVVFLLPLAVVMILTGIPFFLVSYRIGEQSMNAGGLPQWPAKGLIAVGFALLLIQGLSELIKRIAIMRGLIEDPHVHQPSALEAEVDHVVDAIEKR